MFDIELAKLLYLEHQSVYKVGKIMNVHPSNIHKKLQALGLTNKVNVFTKEDDEFLLKFYEYHLSNYTLDVLAKDMGRTKQFICRQAKRLGLTGKKRSMPEKAKLSHSTRMKKWMSENPHPKGALGMKHSDETKKIVSEKSKKMWENMSEEMRDDYSTRGAINGAKATMNRANASWKASWREIGGVRKYYRSRWEANYARYLDSLKIKGDVVKWEHEPETFWFEGIKRGCMSYLPDFKIEFANGRIEYHEVKGWMDDRSITKIKRMAKYHPKVKLVVIDAKAYKKLEKEVKKNIADWE